MRTLLLLLCMLPVFCWGQSSDAATQHQQAVQQLLQQVPTGKIVDLEALAAQQRSETAACSTCALKNARTSSTSSPKVLPSKADLLAERQRLATLIQDLRQAEPVDYGLLNKYLRALRINLEEQEQVDALQQQQARTAAKQRRQATR